MPSGELVLETFFPESTIEGVKPHILSLDDVFFYTFMNFIKGHFRLKKELNFYRLQNWKKSPGQGLNFVPVLALLPTCFSPNGTSPNWLLPKWHFPQLASPQVAFSSTGLFFMPLRIWVPQLPVHQNLRTDGIFCRDCLIFTIFGQLQNKSFQLNFDDDNV